MLKLRQYFCKHDFKCIGKHEICQENLWRCIKCETYYIQHYGMGIGYKCQIPNIGGWRKVG